MESSSRNKMYRAQMRNVFESQHLEKRVNSMERGKVSVLENHLRKTLEIKDMARAARKTSGHSRKATPCDDTTAAQLVKALQTRSTPWCYFTSSTLDTWSASGSNGSHLSPTTRVGDNGGRHHQPPSVPSSGKRPKTADPTALRNLNRNHRKVLPAPPSSSSNSVPDSEVSTGSEDENSQEEAGKKLTGKRDKPLPDVRGRSANAACIRVTSTGISESSENGYTGTEARFVTLPGAVESENVVSRECMFSPTATSSVIGLHSGRESGTERPRKQKRNKNVEILMNPGTQSSMRQVYQSMVTHLKPRGGGVPQRPVTSGPLRTKGAKLSSSRDKSAVVGGEQRNQMTMNQSQSSFGAMSFGTATSGGTTRSRHDSEYSEVFVRDDVSPQNSAGPLSEVGLLQRRARSRAALSGHGFEDRPDRTTLERKSELLGMLQMSEAPTSNRGPKVTFDPSVKGPSDRVRSESTKSSRLTMDSDSESDVDLSKVEKRIVDPSLVAKRQQRSSTNGAGSSPNSSSGRRKSSTKPELQFYIRPEDRHRTEHMFLMRKRSILQRHLRVAKEPVSYGGGSPPGQQLTMIEVSATSSRKCRERALADMVEANVVEASREAREHRISQRLSVQAKVGSFLKKISNFILAQG